MSGVRSAAFKFWLPFGGLRADAPRIITKRNRHMKKTALFCALTPVALASFGAFKITCPRGNAVYTLNQKVEFNIASDVSTNVTLEVIEPGCPTNYFTDFAIEANKINRWAWPYSKPGWVMVGLVDAKRRPVVRAGAMVAPDQIGAGCSDPADFDQYWTNQIEKLRAVPMNPVLKEVALKDKQSVGAHGGKIKIQSFELDCVGPQKAKGYVGLPVNAKPRSLPMIVLFHGAGYRDATLPVWYSDHAIFVSGANGEGSRSDLVFFHDLVMRDLRILEFAKTLPAWNRCTLIVNGESLGGFQALATAALDKDVSFACSCVPALSDHQAYKKGLINGWPKLLNLEMIDAELAKKSEFLDSVNFAKRVGCEISFGTGFIDTTCPPSGVYAAYNAIPKGVRKYMWTNPTAGHEAGNAHGGKRIDEILAQANATPLRFMEEEVRSLTKKQALLKRDGGDKEKIEALRDKIMEICWIAKDYNTTNETEMLRRSSMLLEYAGAVANNRLVDFAAQGIASTDDVLYGEFARWQHRSDALRRKNEIWKHANTFSGIDERLAAYKAEVQKAENVAMTNIAYRSDIWSYYAYEAWTQQRQKEVEYAWEQVKKFGGKFVSYAHQRCRPSLWIWEDYRKFPKDERNIVFPKDLAAFGVKETKTVRAKDFGWSPTNATDCLQKALDSGASTVIVEDMGGPWHIRTVQARSNQRVVFKKGVRILADLTQENFNKPDLFKVHNVSNVMFVGECDDPAEVNIGKYKDWAERQKLQKDYGGSGFDFAGSLNCIVRNMRIHDCSMDGLMFGGLGEINRNMYFEDLLLDSNNRQACSICNGDNLYFKNVKFINTKYNSPACGIDFEPAIEVQANSSCYFFDCEFDNNLGGELNFTTSSYYPVTFYAKRCKFNANGNGGAVIIFARCGVYMGPNVKAPGKLIFEDCDILGYSDVSPVKFETASLLDVEFKDCRITDIGIRKRGGYRGFDASPILFNLNREFWYYFNWKEYKHEGNVVFDNVTVKGFAQSPLIEFRDETGHYSVKNISGKVVFNGKTVDTRQFRYDAPDMKMKDFGVQDPAALKKPINPNPPAEAFTPNAFALNWGGPWYSFRPVYSIYCWGEKGRQASFDINYHDKDKDTETKAWTFEETGWKRFELPGQYKLENFKGTYPVFCGDTKGEHFLKLARAGKDIIGYFEMPEGEAVLKFVGGKAEIRDADGNIVEPLTEYRGSHYVRLNNKSGRNEIWSVRMPHDVPSFLVIKFFEPFNGLFSDDPERLATTQAGLKFCRVTPELIAKQSAEAVAAYNEGIAEGRVNVDIPKSFEKVVAKAVVARNAFAAEKKWRKLAAQEAKRIEAERAKHAGTTDEIAQKEIQDLERGLKDIETVAAIEKAVDAENEGQKRIAAFAQEFLLVAPIGAPHQLKMFMEWKLSGKSVEEYPELAKLFTDPNFKRGVIAALSRFRLALVHDEYIAYEKFSDIASFADEIAKNKIR